MVKLKILESPLQEVHENLALEESLFENLKVGDCLLVLYENRDCIVIGKHQNPWLESSETHSFPIGRRISGGGAVFQDLGNLNFSFIADTSSYDLDRQFTVVLKTLKNLGISAHISNQRDILSSGEKKISGSAFAYRKNKALHHGTLLIESNLKKLENSLRSPSLSEEYESKAVLSRRASVVNLTDYCGNLSMISVKSTLIRTAKQLYSPVLQASISELDSYQQDCYSALLEKHRSWEWCYGKTPTFSLTTKKEPKNRLKNRLKIEIVRGKIQEIQEIKESPEFSESHTLESIQKRYKNQAFSWEILKKIQRTVK